jgi:hypothetical protein
MRLRTAVIAALALVALAVNICAVVRSSERVKVALFAPFEGRYREIGYNALYAARLALRENPRAQVDLLAVDDGGTEAVNRARALALDPLVMGVIALGYDATTPETLAAFGDIPVIVVGEWGVEPINDNVFIFSSPEIAEQISTPLLVSVTDAAALPGPIVGGDVLALEGFAELRDLLDGVTVLSSGRLPDDAYAERYKGDDPFAPEPGLLARLTTSATSITIYGWGAGSRAAMRDYLAVDFPNGYYENAEVHRYEYVNRSLTENAVE